MAVTNHLSLVLVLAAAALAGPASAAECEDAAQALLRRAESAAMGARAPIILEALTRDDRLGCGVVPREHWTSPPALPEGCRYDALDLCPSLDGLPVAAQVAKDVEPKLFVRAQQAAAKLRAAGHLTRPTKRLLQLLLLSDALRRGG